MQPQSSPAPSGAIFSRAIDQALTELTAYKQTYNHALDIGVRPADLVRYVKGKLTPKERVEFERLLAQSPWAMGRVIALVKARRDPSSLTFRAHTIQILNHYAREVPWEDEDLEGCKLLDQL